MFDDETSEIITFRISSLFLLYFVAPPKYVSVRIARSFHQKQFLFCGGLPPESTGA